MRFACFAIGCLAGFAFLLSVSLRAADTATVEQDEQTLREAKVGIDGPALIEFFRKRTIKDFDQAQIKILIRQLGDNSFEVREKATHQLTALGTTAIPYLREALKDPDVEIVRRAEECLRRIGSGASGALVDAAVRLLTVRKPDGAAEALLGYLPFAEDDIAAEEVHQALAALAIRNGKPEPALMNALQDNQPHRQAAAAVALVKSGLAEPRPGVLKLLQSPDATVRLQVGLALAMAGEKKAIPVLIDLLAELPYESLGLLRDLLFRMAEDRAPEMPSGNDPATRRKQRDAWAEWWAKNAEKIDLAKLAQPPKLLGYTMVVLLDEGKILELDEKKEKRWEIDGLEFPLDAQYLPGDRVLIAEQAGNRVSERNLKGEIVWQKQVLDPLVAQRLPDGNTFIANRSQVMEVDRAGKEVFRHMPSTGEQIMRAQRLPNGEIVLVLSATDRNAARFVRLDPLGTTELQTYPVEIHTFGGRIDVLPNRRVVVPQMRNNRVVEHDTRGKIVWEISAEEPIVAIRLPNGNTLATSMSLKKAIEYDRAGKEVWDYTGTTRVTRAWRR